MNSEEASDEKMPNPPMELWNAPASMTTLGNITRLGFTLNDVEKLVEAAQKQVDNSVRFETAKELALALRPFQEDA